MVVVILAMIIVLLMVAVYYLYIPVLFVSKAQSGNDKYAAVDTWLKSLQDRGRFNGAVLLAKDGDVVFSKAYGIRDVEGKRELSVHAAFNLASVSKQFTAMGIMLMKERGVLDYSDEIAKFIPALRHYKGVTIEHLLHHTSGLADYMQLVQAHADDETVITNGTVIALLSKYRPELAFTPGTRFRYSNTGYVLLSEIVARASGMTFEAYMAEAVFEPLKMHDSQVFNLLSEHGPEERVYGMRHRYRLFGGELMPRDLNRFDGVTGDGAVYASVHDIYLWLNALRTGTLLPKEDYEIACKPALLSDGGLSLYGFGWFLNADGSVEHAGGWQGFSSYVYTDMHSGDMIVILDNVSNVLRVNSKGFLLNSIGRNLRRWLKAY